MAKQTMGNCYLCGARLGKTAMKNHILKQHQAQEEEQQCYLVKIEGADNKNYWLYADIPVDKTLAALDSFLRKIWLECCGHFSAFLGAGHMEIGKSRKLSSYSIGERLVHEYDFGSTTQTLITIVGETTRMRQRELVRLLARNVAPAFECAACGKPAAAICCECMYEPGNPFYCDECARRHEHDDMLLPAVNSPRMGVCGYAGELDVYAFDPGKYSKGSSK